MGEDREKELGGFHPLPSFSRRPQCLINFYISQNIAALLKTFMVIFRHLRLFFVPKSSLQDYKQEASWKARVLGLLWTASASWRGGEGLPQPLVPQQGSGTSSRDAGWAGTPRLRDGAWHRCSPQGLERQSRSTVPHVPV